MEAGRAHHCTIFDKDHDTTEEGRSQTEAFAGGNYSRLQKIVYTGEVECVPNSKSAEGGVKLVMHMAVLKS